MSELICTQGHVIDSGKEICSRCNSGVAQAPVAEVPAQAEAEKPKRKVAAKVAKPVEKKPKAVKPKAKSKGKK